jgi:hypothetical protein
MGDILDTGVEVGQLEDLYVRLALYGRNGIGKTTLACCGKKPLALIAIDPAPTGGARSVMSMDGITVYRVAGRPLIDPKTKQPEKLWGSQKALAIAESLHARFAKGLQPFKTVVIDGITAWNAVILQEILGVAPNDMPAILQFGSIGQDQYRERAERIIRYNRPFLDLPCDVTIIAQERDHNPPKDENNRVMGSKLLRDADVNGAYMQSGSFFSLDVGDTPARWFQDNCDFVGQMYQDMEYKEHTTPPMKGPDGTLMPAQTSMIPTGKRVRRLRTQYHPNYAARVRGDYRVVPEYIQAETPEEMYAALMQVVRGEKTLLGHYPKKK